MEGKMVNNSGVKVNEHIPLPKHDDGNYSIVLSTVFDRNPKSFSNDISLMLRIKSKLVSSS